MATTDRLKLMDPLQETEQARTLASRYRCEFVDLREVRIDHACFIRPQRVLEEVTEGFTRGYRSRMRVGTGTRLAA